VATYASRLAEKLRQEGLATQHLIVSMRTNRFAQMPQYEASQEMRLDAPTNHTDQLLSQLLPAAEAIFRPGFEYYKAAVYAPALVEANLSQTSLFDTAPSPKSQQLMETLDHINQHLGAGSIQYGAVGLKQAWRTRVGYPSKRYTTSWDELPLVKA